MPYMEDCLDWPLSRVLPLLQQRIMEGSSYHGIPTMKSPLDFWKNSGKHSRSWRGNIGRYLLAGYLLGAAILILTGLNIMTLLGVIALFAGFFILIGR